MRKFFEYFVPKGVLKTKGVKFRRKKSSQMTASVILFKCV